jgi:CheY-like chemotaxis protein
MAEPRFQVYLHSSDSFLAGTAQEACRGSVATLVACEEWQQAQRDLAEARYDLLILDVDDSHRAREVLRGCRTEGPNMASAVLAVVNAETNSADILRLGANTVVYKPVQRIQLGELIKQVRARQALRQHQRVSVGGEAFLWSDGNEERLCVLVDLSEGGAAISEIDGVRPGEVVRLKFRLPGLAVPVHANGESAWCYGSRAGIRFTSVRSDVMASFRTWLRSRLRGGKAAQG